nr:SpoIIIAH-like family protein [Metabacillus lacus]
MLKKQTVWLLTMLSLVVVLSVYYITSPENDTNNVVMTGNGEKSEGQSIDQMTEESEKGEQKPAEEKQPAGEEKPKDGEQPKDDGAADKEGAEQPGKDGEQPGTSKDGKQQTEEDAVTEELEDGTVISSVESDELFTTMRMELEDARSERKQELQDTVANKDVSAVEKSRAYDELRELQDIAAKESILETLLKSRGYDDALVRADGNKVKITVKSKEATAAKANEIIMLVKGEIDKMEDVAVTFEPSNN